MLYQYLCKGIGCEQDHQRAEVCSPLFKDKGQYFSVEIFINLLSTCQLLTKNTYNTVITLFSLFLNCIQNDVTSQRLSWDVRLKKPRPILVLCKYQVISKQRFFCPAKKRGSCQCLRYRPQNQSLENFQVFKFFSFNLSFEGVGPQDRLAGTKKKQVTKDYISSSS